jgi:hypothetical protein
MKKDIKEKIEAFLKEASELSIKHKLGFAGFDGGLYLFDLDTDHSICEEGDIDWVGNKYDLTLYATNQRKRIEQELALRKKNG